MMHEQTNQRREGGDVSGDSWASLCCPCLIRAPGIGWQREAHRSQRSSPSTCPARLWLIHTHAMRDEMCSGVCVAHCVTYACWSSAGRCASPAADGVWPRSHTCRRCRCRSGWSASGCCWAQPACSAGSPSSDRVCLPGERSNEFQYVQEEMSASCSCKCFSHLFRWGPLCFPGSPRERFLLRTPSLVTWRNVPLRHPRHDGSPLKCKEYE